MKILIVEDDPGIAEVLNYALTAAGHEAIHVSEGRDAITRSTEVDCVVLDVGLPDVDGFEVCRAIRKKSDKPILFLTSRSDEIDRVVGLEIGGDDYLTKPFSTRELLARIKAIMRRLQPTAPVDLAPSLDISIDPEKRSVLCHGKPVELSRLEFDLLAMLLAQRGRVFTRDQILNHAWPDGGCVTDRTVDAHVKSLRKKLGDADLVETVRGVGYRLRDGAA
ncbi:beta-lactam response regulator transcription factor BlrA [soil metagenome]